MEKEIRYLQTYIIFLKLIYLYLFLRQKGSGVFTAGYAGDDVTGDKKLDYAVRNTRFDYFASSIGYDLNGQKKINSLELTGKSSRLDGKYIEIYVSDTGNDEDWTMVNPENIGFQKTGSALKVLFKKYIETSYIKIHSTWDERDEDYLPVDKSEVNGNVADIVEVFYLAEGKDSSWTYDAKGNRITSSERLGNNHSSKTVEYYANSDLIKKYGDWYFGYDKNGNLTSRGTSAVWNEDNGVYDYSSVDGELWQYEYDLSNRMTRVMFSENGKNGLKNKASYTYDYRGLLVKKVSEDYTEYRDYSIDGKLLYTQKGNELTDYIYKGNTVFAEIRKEGSVEAVYYHHTDHLGTTEAITDSNGTVVWEAEYEAFGSVLSQNGTKAFTASFTGKMYDAEAGMYYFNARWYNSEIGRFVTEDPARDGMNWYAYCGNNPLVFIDVNGLESDAIKELYVRISNRGISIYSESYNYLAIITFSGETNESKGSSLGTLRLYTPNQFDQNHNLKVNEPILSVPIISGANFKDGEGKLIKHDRIQDGIYINAYMRQPQSNLLKDPDHSTQTVMEDGTIEFSPIWDIPNSGNRVVHQGNNSVTQNGGYTEGCPAITGPTVGDASNNYQSFIDSMDGHNLNILVMDSSKGYNNNSQGVTYYEK